MATFKVTAFKVTVRRNPMVVTVDAGSAREALEHVRVTRAQPSSLMVSAEDVRGEAPGAEVFGACEACNRLLLIDDDGNEEEYHADEEGVYLCGKCVAECMKDDE